MNGALNDETAISPSQPSESEQSETTVESNHENLSKETTKQYKDYSGVDTESFIIETLRDHPKDRGLLLSLEKFFQDFIQDDQQMNYQFQAMNSYERMIVHRVAAYFGLHHNTDKNAQCVVISKTPNMRIPELSFRTVIENQSTDFKSTETTNRGFRENKKPIRMNPTKPLPTSSQLNSSIVPMNSMTMPNYVPLIHTNGSAYYGAHGIPFTPILIHSTPNGPIQYLYPAAPQPAFFPSDRLYTSIYRSDLLPPTPFVPLQYPTNQFAALTLQSPIRSMTTTNPPVAAFPPPPPPRNYLGRPFVQASTITKKSRPTKSSDKSKSD